MVSPLMADQTMLDVIIQNKDCLPPNTADAKPWILYVGILGFILPFTALIVLQVLVLIKQQGSMEKILNRYEKKVRTSVGLL